jgi:hypothetical protein
MKRRKVSEKMFQFRLSEKEMEEFNRAFAKTPYRSKSEYSRKMLLGKPVTIFYRNKSLDELTELVIALKKDLQSLSTSIKNTTDNRGYVVVSIRETIEKLIKVIEACSPK